MIIIIMAHSKNDKYYDPVNGSMVEGDFSNCF